MYFFSNIIAFLSFSTPNAEFQINILVPHNNREDVKKYKNSKRSFFKGPKKGKE